MFEAVIILIIIVAVLLVLVVLAQNSKGGGLSSQFGGAGASQVMGVKKTGDFLEKLTWGLAVVLITLTLSTKLLITGSGEGYTSPNIESAQDQVVTPNLDLPEGEPMEESESLDNALESTEE